MSGVTVRRERCEKCNVKISNKQPMLRCSLCYCVKHLKCQKLTKADAKYILYLKNPWSCTECISNILPLDACSTPKNTETKPKKFKVKCSSVIVQWFLIYSYKCENMRLLRSKGPFEMLESGPWLQFVL